MSDDTPDTPHDGPSPDDRAERPQDGDGAPARRDEAADAGEPADAANATSGTTDDASSRGPLGPEAAVDQVQGAAEAVKQAATFDLPELADGGDLPDDPAGINLLNDVRMRVQVELGRTRMYVEDVLRLGADSVIELDKAAGDPVDIYVNDRHVARGEVLVLNDNFCVRISEIIRNSVAEGGEHAA